jgi:hypothetical protein
LIKIVVRVADARRVLASADIINIYCAKEAIMDWVCSGCGRHFNWTISECPYCSNVGMFTTGGTGIYVNPSQENDQIIALEKKIKALEEDVRILNSILKVMER